MSNPHDPSQQNQRWGQSPYPQQPAQGYDGGAPQAAPAQGPGQRSEQPQAQPAQIDWNSAPPEPSQAPWQGPSPFGPAPSSHEPWVAAGTAQTAQEVADRWQAAQPPAPAADYQQQPAADPYQPPTPEPQAHQASPEPALQSPAAPPAPQQHGPSYDAPPPSPSINEAATVTTPAVADAADAPEEPEALTIGRGRDNSIVLDDMLVSRQHVRITADADGLVLEDLGSRNGTYVNGRRVERTHLSEGDRIGIGASTFEVRDGWLLNV
jgi:hypothetical protein